MFSLKTESEKLYIRKGTMERTGFKTRARVVDLLGREQIADAPTAITELLKNAIDAQADTVNVHYRTHERMLEISDDGLGMRTQDLLERWMVLATDSKHGKPDDSWLKFASQEQKSRARSEKPFGEKGIGRLAVASLGNGVLVWTRWGKGKEMQRTLALVHWHFFRFPKLNLDEVFVPYVPVGPDDNPGELARLLVDDLKGWMAKEVENLTTNETTNEIYKVIQKDLDKNFKNAIDGIQEFEMKSSGVSFYVLHTTDEVEDIFRYDEKISGQTYHASEGMRTFFGFCNPFSSNTPRLKVNAYINERKAYSEQENFWDVNDFKAVDHYIDLTINNTGYVTGTIHKYNKAYKYNYQVPELQKRADFPGPITLKVGYVPGDIKESNLSAEQFKSYTKRVNEYGALYVYRDNIRVMPYGRADEDFMEFEYRRSLNAGRYFFSHRRMFGAIFITKKGNPNLIDKAGREGFIKNKQYRGLNYMLTRVFIDLADTFFGTNAGENKKSKQNKKDKNKESPTDIEIKEATRIFLQKFLQAKKHLETAGKRLSNEITELKKMEVWIKGKSLDSIERASQMYDEIRNGFQDDLDLLIDTIPDLAQPSNKNLASWDSYLTDRQRFENRWQKELLDFRKKLDAAIKKNSSKIEYLRSLETKLENSESELIGRLKNKKDRMVESARDISVNKGPAWFDIDIKQIKRVPRDALGENPAQSVVEGSSENAVLFDQLLFKQKKLVMQEIEPRWDGILTDLERIANARSMNSALGELARDRERLREQDAVYTELAQIGLIVEGIDHEYRSLFSKAREDFQKLQNEFSFHTLDHLESLFNAINEKISSLSPLYRTGKTKYETITKSNIENFVKDRYSEQYAEKILQVHDGLKYLRWKGVNKSVLFAAIVNVINNALYWINKTGHEKLILVTIDPKGFVISDSGPGVVERDADRIFDPFFSRKPSGRGLGLYLSRTAMRHHNMDLILLDGVSKDALPGANFLFQLPDEEEELDYEQA